MAQLSHVADANWHWEVTHVHGEGFTGSTNFRCYLPLDARAVSTIVAEYAATGKPAAPATPSPVQNLNIKRYIDAQNFAVIWRGDTGAGFPGRCKFLYAFDSAYSNAILVNEPRINWIDKESAVAGEQFTIFGFNLIQRSTQFTGSTTTTGWLIPTGGGSPIEVPIGLTNDDQQRHFYGVSDYILMGQVPAGTAVGTYNFYIHTGEAGVYGCAGPVPLTVTTAAASPTVFSLTSYSGLLVGEDWADPLQAAVLAAGFSTPSVVTIPAGTYKLGRTIVIPIGVRLRGAGMNNTFLEAMPNFSTLPVKPAASSYPPGPNYASLFFVDMAPQNFRMLLWTIYDTDITELSLETAYQVPQILVMLWNRASTTPVPLVAKNIKVRRCKFRRSYMDVLPINGVGFGAQGDWSGRGIYSFNMQRCSFTENEFYVPAGIDAWSTLFSATGEANRHNVITDNLFSSHWGANSMSVGCLVGGWRQFISRNRFRGLYRGISLGPQRAQAQHTYFNNIFENIGYNDAGGEAILLENFHGNAAYSIIDKPTAIGTDGTGDYLDFSPSYALALNTMKNQWCTITDGKGAGQYREILQNVGNRVYLTGPTWKVAPDTTSTCAAGRYAAENVFIGNMLSHCSSAFTLAGGNVGCHFILNQIVGSEFGFDVHATDTATATGLISGTPADPRLTCNPLFHLYFSQNQVGGGGMTIRSTRLADYATTTHLWMLGIRMSYNTFGDGGIVTVNEIYSQAAFNYLEPTNALHATMSPSCKGLSSSHDRYEEATRRTLRLSGAPRQMRTAAMHCDYGFNGITFWKPAVVQNWLPQGHYTRPAGEIVLGPTASAVSVLG